MLWDFGESNWSLCFPICKMEIIILIFFQIVFGIWKIKSLSLILRELWLLLGSLNKNTIFRKKNLQQIWLKVAEWNIADSHYKCGPTIFHLHCQEINQFQSYLWLNKYSLLIFFCGYNTIHWIKIYFMSTAFLFSPIQHQMVVSYVKCEMRQHWVSFLNLFLREL